MYPLLKKILWALLFDEKAARRQLRGVVGVLAVSGALYADQVAALAPASVGPKLSIVIRGLSVLCAFAVAAHGDPTKRPDPAPEAPRA